MDFDNTVPIDGLETLSHRNGIHDEQSLAAMENDCVVSNGCLENASKLHDGDTNDNTYTEKVTEGSNVNAESNGTTVSKDGDVKNEGPSQQAKSLKGPGKSKDEKISNPKNISAIQLKKPKDGKVSKKAASGSNHSVTSNPQSKKPSKSQLFNERPVQEAEHPAKSSDVMPSQHLKETTKLKNLKEGVAKAEEDTQATLSPTAADAKPRRVGALPNYGFSFKCDERAERRKEFYSKLEEKIHAKEVEKNNLQAKSKETQEAEIKLFRKSLTFKATPMPSFYQEPLPPRTELKKIPPTRPKSPKLGRRKSSSHPDSEENDGQSNRLTRLSLDQKVSKNISAQGPSSVHAQKSQRKSLPKLPSQKTSLSSPVNDENIVSFKATEEESAVSFSQINEGSSPVIASELDTQTEDEPVNGEQAMPILVQEPIPSEPYAKQH